MRDKPFAVSAVDEIRAAVEPFHWGYAQTDSVRIDAHWRERCAISPALFNGAVLMMHRWESVTEGARKILRTGHFVTEFKSFLAWRSFGFPDTSVRNCFAMAALQSADGAFILGVMGDHTSSAGQIYFPAGTPDPGDIVGDRLDLDGSALRELEEETGLDPGRLSVQPGWSVIDAGPRLGCMKIMRSHEDAASLSARITGWLAVQDMPELSGVHIVRRRADILRARMPDFMIDWLEAMLPAEPTQPG